MARGKPGACRRRRSSPRSPSSTGFPARSPGCDLIRDIPVALQVRVLVDPPQRRTGLELQLPHQPGVAGPAPVLVQQDDKQRGRVGAAVVGRMGSLLEGGQLAVAHLVEDAAGILVAEVVDAGALPERELAVARRRQSWLNGRACRLVDAVAPEHGHEPGSPAAGRLCVRRSVSRNAARSTRLRR